jgi:hypothetical protein
VKRVTPTIYDSSAKELLLLLGEEIKQPLVAIAQLAEIQSGNDIQAHAAKALKTIDNVLLYQRIHSGQTALQLQPVHIGSTIQEVAHSMEPIMKAAGCRTELIIQHGLSPVDADRRLLSSALQSLWQAFLGTIQTDHAEIICRAKKTPQGVRVSLHSKQASIDDLHFAKSNSASSQPLTGIAGPATDLLTANGMFELLGAELTKSSTPSLSGIGATLIISKQLQMI